MISFYGGPNGSKGEQGLQGEKGEPFKVVDNIVDEQNKSLLNTYVVSGLIGSAGDFLAVYYKLLAEMYFYSWNGSAWADPFLLGTNTNLQWYDTKKNAYLTRKTEDTLVEGQLNFDFSDSKLKISTMQDGETKSYSFPGLYSEANPDGVLRISDVRLDQVGDIRLRDTEDKNLNDGWIQLPHLFEDLSEDEIFKYSLKKYATSENLVFKEIAKNQEPLDTKSKTSRLSDFLYDNKSQTFFIKMIYGSEGSYNCYSFTINDDNNLIFQSVRDFPQKKELWNSTDNTYFIPENKVFSLADGSQLYLNDYESGQSNLTTKYAVYQNTEGEGCLINKENWEVIKSVDLADIQVFFEIDNNYYIIKDLKLYSWDNQALSVSFIRDLTTIMPSTKYCNNFYFSEENNALFFGGYDTDTNYFGVDVEKLIDTSYELKEALFFKFYPQSTTNYNYYEVYSHYILDSGTWGSNREFSFKLYDLESIFPIQYTFTIPKQTYQTDFQYLKIK